MLIQSPLFRAEEQPEALRTGAATLVGMQGTQVISALANKPLQQKSPLSPCLRAAKSMAKSTHFYILRDYYKSDQNIT